MDARIDTGHSQESQFVTFRVAGESYGLEITRIREIRRWAPVTPLPHSPADVLGVMNLRGAVIPIFDLSVRFGFGPTRLHERNVVIVTAVEEQVTGLLVEAVSEILSIPVRDIQKTPGMKSEAARQSIMGVVAMGEDMIRLVDLGAVIDAGPDAVP